LLSEDGITVRQSLQITSATKSANHVIRCTAEKTGYFAVSDEPPYGTHTPVEEPSTASKAGMPTSSILVDSNHLRLDNLMSMSGLRSCTGAELSVFRFSIDIMQLFPISASPGKKIATATEPLGFGRTIPLP
jgi:hypothetical protein